MKKVLVFLILITAFFGLFSLYNPVLAGSTSNFNLNCGNAYAKDEGNKCCSQKPVTFVKTPSDKLFGLIPGINGKLKELDQKEKGLQELQKKYSVQCFNGNPQKDPKNGGCICMVDDSSKIIPKLTEMCINYVKGTDQLNSCLNCMKQTKFWSGFGCIPLNIEGFITSYLLGWGVKLGGLIAFFCIIYSAFILQTSKGNPEKIKKAQEYLTSCILGLLLIIFAVFILKLIGVDVLKIPGLS